MFIFEHKFKEYALTDIIHSTGIDAALRINGHNNRLFGFIQGRFRHCTARHWEHCRHTNKQRLFRLGQDIPKTIESREAAGLVALDGRECL